MIWQDLILTIVSVLFSYALLPQIIYGFKTKNTTLTYSILIINSIGMFTVAIVYFTLGLPIATTVSFITATLWTVLLLQKIIYK